MRTFQALFQRATGSDIVRPRMSEPTQWDAVTYEGSRKAQLRQTLALTVRERLELLDQLNQTAERLASMPRTAANPAEARAAYDPGDGRPR